ncbi:hypothetical protein B5807_09143 [Epicoccum nigrum]|uniref:Myb-like DNA-binding domain-containing protein n=1 Tax=Epicoccum nigrum TaxID=105696 RepID=A0A1Y2LMF5_EPING|nr:hypothetical protein B5807_09143 [Epicoccum nigrum]
MPTASEDVKFIYLVLTDNGQPTIDWDPICAALKLGKGAATKRWSRLKQAVDKGEEPPASAQELLWLMLKHSTANGKHDWGRIAEACGSTPGAVSKRYSRLKLSIERGDGPPSAAQATSSSPPATPAASKKPSTKGKAKGKAEDGDSPTPTPKRKRASKAATAVDSDDDEVGLELKRAKTTPKSKPRPKAAFRASDKKGAKSEPDQDIFSDAHEYLVPKAESDPEEVSLVLMTPVPSSTFFEASVCVREMTYVFLNRIDLEQSLDVVDK